jgi:hypothetical protein
VPEAPVVRHRFERVPDRVAEVQNLPRPRVVAPQRLALVARDDARLERALCGDDLREFSVAPRVRLYDARAGRTVTVPARLFRQKPLRPLEEAAVADGALLDGLAPARGQLAPRECLERRGVHHDGRRLVEGADEVLARGGVDAGLAPDRRVYLREQRRRRLHERHAAQVERRREPRHVPDHAAAERDDRVAPLKPRPGQEPQRALGRPHRLEALALAHQPVRDLEARRPQRRDGAFAVESEHARVRDECHLTRLLQQTRARGVAQPRERARADLDPVPAPAAQTHGHAQRLQLVCHLRSVGPSAVAAFERRD